MFPFNKILSSSLRRPKFQNKRALFYWLTIVWNRVDEKRIKEVGAERACAEWLLRNGASVKWKGAEEFLKDYNALEDIAKPSTKFIEAVDATESSISHIGFPYFCGCKYVKEVKLIKCEYIENEALRRLNVLKESLERLEVLHCGNITDSALLSLKNLENLKLLKLRGMPYVKNKTGVERELSEALPNCKIEWR